MRLFISWSRPSAKSIADILAKWFRNITYSKVDPFCSLHDIEPGEQWTRRITNELAATDYGVLCLTKENLDSPWMHFEAGCLSKHITNARVCPLLFGMVPTDLHGPLSQFQAVQFNREGIKHLLDTFNKALGEDALNQESLDANFGVLWVKLQRDIEEALSAVPPKATGTIRSDREIIEEILSLTRAFARSRETGLSTMDLAPLGVLRMYKQRPSTDYLQNLIKEAESGTIIRVLGVCMMGFANAPMQAILGQKLQENCSVRLLTLSADSAFVRQRALEEDRDEQDIRNDIVNANKIHRNFVVQRVPEQFREKIELRHYDSPPSCFMLGADTRMIVGFYLREQRGEFLPHLELAVTTGGIWTMFVAHFEALWETAEKCIKDNR